MKYRVLSERLAVCRIAPNVTIPAWALESGFLGIVRTRDELSIVCPEKVLDNQMQDGITAERGWLALKLDGPFPFAMTGVLASFLRPLAAAVISIFAISTFDTDYVLIKSQDVERAVVALGNAGHQRIDGSAA